jgi:hypothetical protein
MNSRDDCVNATESSNQLIVASSKINGHDLDTFFFETDSRRLFY